MSKYKDEVESLKKINEKFSLETEIEQVIEEMEAEKIDVNNQEKVLDYINQYVYSIYSDDLIETLKHPEIREEFISLNLNIQIKNSNELDQTIIYAINKVIENYVLEQLRMQHLVV